MHGTAYFLHANRSFREKKKLLRNESINHRAKKRVAEAYLRQLNAARVFGKPLATKVTPLEAFYPAEEYHQNFIERHPDNSYVMFNDLPKLEQLHKTFPELETTR